MENARTNMFNKVVGDQLKLCECCVNVQGADLFEDFGTRKHQFTGVEQELLDFLNKIIMPNIDRHDSECFRKC